MAAEATARTKVETVYIENSSSSYRPVYVVQLPLAMPSDLLYLQAAVIGERRVNVPYGMHGGEPGQRGCSYWMRKNEDGTLRRTKMKPSQTIDAKRGERLIIHTPGGGGYGKPQDIVTKETNGVTNGVNGHANDSLVEKIKQTIFHPIANGSLNAWQNAAETSQ